MTAVETLRLVRFFSALAVKEHLRPGLHVRPLVAELFLTDNCNLRCVSCNCWRDTTQGELTTDEWTDVLRQLARERILKINFTGGEPLIRKDAVDVMQAARALGFRRMHLNTNAILLTPEKLDLILDAGVQSFNVSVDGTGALHDEIRGRPGAYETTLTHLRTLRAKPGLKVRMNFTLMRDNAHALPEMAELAQEIGVRLYVNLVTDKTFLFRADEVGAQTRVGAKGLEEALVEVEAILRRNRRFLPRFSDLDYIQRHFGDLRQSGLPCAESQLKLMVHSRGEVGGCWAHDPIFNVRHTSIASVLASDHYREEHARLFRKECVGCGSNYSLNLRWRPRSYVGDLLWRVGLRGLGGST